jgi:hypothetical protein
LLGPNESRSDLAVPDQAWTRDDERVEIVSFRCRVEHVPRVRDVGDGLFDGEQLCSRDAVLCAVLRGERERGREDVSESVRWYRDTEMHARLTLMCTGNDDRERVARSIRRAVQVWPLDPTHSRSL